MSRLSLSDSLAQSFMKLADNNPGAVVALASLPQEGLLDRRKDPVDPDAFMGSLSCMIMMDEHEIYGEQIHDLYKYLCKQKPVLLVGMMRGLQMGFCTGESLKQKVYEARRGENIQPWVDKVMQDVRKELPNFIKSDDWTLADSKVSAAKEPPKEVHKLLSALYTSDPFPEKFNAYRFTGVVESDQDARHDGPTPVCSQLELMSYIQRNIEKFPEIRVTDRGDDCVFHVVNQSLLFPVPEEFSGNKWNPETCRFEKHE